MPSAPGCPDLATYKRLAFGPMSPEEREQLLQHLKTCDACAGKLRSLPQEDTLGELLRADTLGDAPPDGMRARLADRLNQLGPGTVAQSASDMITLPCPGCAKIMHIRPEGAGKRARCARCGQVVRVPGPGPAPEAGLEAATVPPPQESAVGGTQEVEAEPYATDETFDYTTANKLYDFLAPPQAPDELGRLGPYRVLEVLGAGGMGVVFRAEDPMLQRLVALKAMLPGMAAVPNAKQRFLREARMAAAIRHDHVVAIYQVGEDRGVPWLAMEFLEGEPLDERLKREKALSVAEVVRIGQEVAEGLEAAHERGQIHRDIKPANIWLEGKRGRAKILDFGLARSAEGSSNLTQSGAIVGTPAYMAPEQAQGKPVDHRGDLFSLGCVLYRMAAGRPAFQGADTISTLLAVATAHPPTPARVNPTVPVGLSDLITRMLAKAPGDRPTSAREVAETLERLSRPKAPKEAPPPRKAPPPNRPTPPPPPKRPVSANPAPPKRPPAPGDTIPQAPPPVAPRRATPAPSAEPPLAIQPKDVVRPRRSCAGLAATAVLLLGSLALVGGGIAFFLTYGEPGHGTLALESDADDVQVRVSRAGEQVAVLDAKTNPEVSLAVGAYDLELIGGKEGQKLQSARVVLARGGREFAKVTTDSPTVPVPDGTAGAPNGGTAVTKPPTPAPGFRSIFNGKDLAGWKVLPEYPGEWSVEDGLLVGRGTKPSGLFTTRGVYENFHFLIEAKINDGGRAGQFFRTGLGLAVGPKGKVKNLDGYEAVISALPAPAKQTGSLEPKLHFQTEPLVQPDQWFTQEVIADGDRLVVKVNGKTVTDVRDESLKFRRGHLALQALAPKSVLHVKRAEVKELPGAAPEGFDPLFNGKDLRGWKTHSAQPHGWTVEGGYLIGRADKGTTHLFTGRDDFTDFHLRAEVKANDFGNSGIYFRTPYSLTLQGQFPGGYEAQILNRSAVPGTPLTGSLFNLHNVSSTPTRADDWFVLEVMARGPNLAVVVNGIPTAKYADSKKGAPTRGHIALQAMSPDTTVVQFRRIDVKDLPKDVAPVKSGFVPLFDGKTLAGWKTHPEDKAKWEVKDGAIVGTGPVGHLYSDRDDYENFHFLVEAKINDKGNSGQYFRAKYAKGFPQGYEAQINFGHNDLVRTGSLHPAFNPKLTPAQRKQITVTESPHHADEWFTQEVIAVGNRIFIKVNGQQMVNFVDDNNTYTRGHFALQHLDPGTVVSFRRVEVMELPPGK
jgi:serine/threonine protein kinase